MATAYSPTLITRFHEIPGRRWLASEKLWTFPLAPDTLAMVCDAVGMLPNMLPDDLASVLTPSQRAPATVPVDMSRLNSVQWLTQPFEHQRRNLALLLSNTRWLIADEQGTGKSHAIANRLKILLQDYPRAQVLILCPKSVINGWIDQLYMHAGLVGVPLVGTTAQRQKLLRASRSIWVTSYETFRTDVRIQNVSWKALVLDEVQKCKNFSSQICRTVREVSERTHFVWGLSGTPAPNGLQDWNGVLAAVSPRLLPVRTKTAFEARYCVKEQIGSGIWKISGYRNVAELHDYVTSMTSRVTKAQCLDLPPKTYAERVVTLAGEQRRVYLELRKDAVARLGKAKSAGLLTVNNVLTESLRLLQVVGGFVPDDDGRVHELPDKAKLEALAEVLDEVGTKQLLVWCAFRAEVVFLAQWLHSNYAATVTLTGDTHAQQRAVNIEAFRSGEARYFVGTAAAGGVGINGLQVADTVVYYSRDYNLATYLQSQDRAHRIGTVRSVSIIRLLATNTVDEKVHAALEQKETLQNLLLGRPEDML